MAYTILRSLPNLFVFVLLCGIIYAGHSTGWKLPKFGETAGQNNNWCGDHLVPEAECVECSPNLLPKEQEFGWCKLHGVNQCVIDHPELAQVENKGHDKQRSETTCQAIALMKRTENNPGNTLYTKRVQFTTADAVQKTGIAVDIAGEGAVTETISANGEITFNPYRVATLSAKSAGTVAAVLKHIGSKVKTGEILALIDTAQVGQLKSQLLKDVVNQRLQQDNLQRVKALIASKAASPQDLVQAESMVQQAAVAVIAAKQQLTNLGFALDDENMSAPLDELSKKLQYLGIPDDIVQTLPPTAKNDNLLPVLCPFDGEITDTNTVLGTAVDTTKVLLTVADPTQMWMILNVRQEDASSVKIGQQVQFAADNGDQQASGIISWINPSVDEKTRTLRVRAEIANPDGKLRGHIFGEGKIVLRQEPNAVLIPAEAVQATADSLFVFVRDKNFFDERHPKIFYPRQIVLGAKAAGANAGKVEVLAGVLPGEVIATKGSNVLLAHLLRSNLGAGCCAED